MSKLQKEIFNRTLKSGKEQKIVSVTRKDNKRLITENDIVRITKELHTKLSKEFKHKDFKINVVTFDIDRKHTFNVSDDGDILGYDEDYYVGRVSNTGKFEKTGRVDLIVQQFK